MKIVLSLDLMNIKNFAQYEKPIKNIIKPVRIWLIRFYYGRLSYAIN